VQCSGWNGYMQLGSSEVAKDADSGPVFVDLDLASGEKVVSIASRTARSCAVTNLGDLWCWGDNVPPSVVKVHTASDKAVDVRGGNENLCVLRTIDGTPSQLWCEGSNSQNQLSPQPTSSALAFWRIPGLVAPIKSFDAAGPYNLGTICAQDAEGFKCSGNNQIRQAGRGPDFYDTTPLPVMGWMN
jgi:hypothetical protein